MKRIISYLMVLSIILAGAAALTGAAEAAPAENALRLSFSDVEKQINSKNLTIRNNQITIQNINSMLDDDAITALIASQNLLLQQQRSTSNILGQIVTASPTGLDDPYQGGLVAALRNDIMSFEMSIQQISGQIEQVHNAPRASRDRTVQQLNNVNRQIIWGAESLYMGYHALTRQLDQTKETLGTLNRNIGAMERRLSLGQITEHTLKTMKSSRTQLEQGIKSMENELVNIKGQMNLLLGRKYDAPLEISALPAAEKGFLKTIDRTRDLRLAIRSNYLINIAIIDIEEQARKISESARKQEAIARNNYDSETRAVEQKYENLIKAITDKETLLVLEENQLSLVRQAYDEANKRYGLGRVSRLELEQAGSDVLVQTIKVKSAEAELFSAIRRYEWLVRGLSV